jgi:hypothetical protein
MTAARTEHEQALIAEIETHGVVDYRVEQGRKHKRLVFAFNGREIAYVFSGTPSDRKATLCALRDLRRVMGVRRVARKKSPAAKARKKAPRRAPECPVITMRDDPFAALAALQGLAAAAEIEAGLDVPTFCEVHSKREPIRPAGPSLWRRFCDGMRRLA